jgi:cellulose biosynthesis protein BcsQ
MSVPVLTFFNNKGGVGKTSLAYHIAWMMSEIGQKVLVCDLDPQANLTAAFLPEEKLDELWNSKPSAGDAGATIFKCVEPLMSVGDLRTPQIERISPTLGLVPGDLALSGFEDMLSGEWPNALGSDNLFRPFRILSAFWSLMQDGARQMDATVIIADVGPNLGAINRSALIATDFVIVPLTADLFSLQGLRNLGPKLRSWRADWAKRLGNWAQPEFPLPQGKMEAIGYVVQQHSVRLDRPVKAYDKWLTRIPVEYAKAVKESSRANAAISTDRDQSCLASLKHYRSLVPMAQESRKPIFRLTSADGAIGSHAGAVQSARGDFRELATKILKRAGVV